MAKSLAFTIEVNSACKYATIEYAISGLTGESLTEDFTSVVFENLTTTNIYTALPTCSDYTVSYFTQSPTDISATLMIPFTCLQIDGESANLTTLPDGLYCVTLTMTLDDDSTVTQEVSYLSTCDLCCKVRKLATNLDLNCGCCNDDCYEELWKFMEADALLTALLYAGACGAVSEINTNIKNIQEFLANIDCSNC